MNLILDGKRYKREDNSAVKKIKGYLDSLPYGKAITKETLANFCKYKDANNITLAFKINKDPSIETYRYRVSYHLVIWANPKTIQDLKNGKFQL